MAVHSLFLSKLKPEQRRELEDRLYRHCQREGWIEKRHDEVWKITPKGESVAAQAPNPAKT